jgi:tetratricopeptide (TPR) repeat protein
MEVLYAVVERHRKARGMSLRGLAKAVPCDASYLSKALRGLKPCGPKLAKAIDDALAADGEIIQAAARSNPAEGTGAGAAGAREVMTWLTVTNASDDAIEELARSADYLADAHTRLPATRVLREVLKVHQAVHLLLRGGRQRLVQTRVLLRTDSALLSHACLLLGDLGKYEAARQYGKAALLCAQEAEADEGLAWTAIAKTARWQDRFAEAAGLAARGFEASGTTPVRAELAYREANAMALFGDTPRAREALRKAMRVSEGLDDDGTSAWSFSRGRVAVFTVSVCIHTDDPDGALRAAQEADAYWDAGGGKVAATWAQVRAGAAIAYLLKNSLDGAAAQLGPVLELSPDHRIRTVTGYLDEIGGMLRAWPFAGNPIAVQLGEQITEFNGAAANMDA